ncbi:MAG: hypothetical protein IJ039_08415 [Clostridia bacterium]|nr:hypothetical protein [Clostridia bacterium]
MESKIYIIRKDLRALKKSSRTIKRLIELQGIHFKRIRALEAMSNDTQAQALIEKEKEIALSLKLKEQIEESQSLEAKYMDIISRLDPTDKAMVLDCFLNGMPYWKLGMEYGFAEEGARKHIESIVKRIAQRLE